MTTDPDPAGQLLSLPPPRMNAGRLARLVEDHWGLTGSYTQLTSERDLNHRLDTATASFTVKLSNPAEPSELTDFQTRALLHAAVADPDLPTPRVIPTRDGHPILRCDEGALRLLGWCPGTPVAHLPRTPALAWATGAALARLTAALASFDHRAADHVLFWDIRQFPRLAPLLNALPADLGHDLQPGAAAFLDQFKAEVAPALARLPKQVVHADFNPHNLLADPTRPDTLTGILDFGDMVRSHKICDLATACSYQIDPADPLHLLAPLLSAYHAHLPLTEAEIRLLPSLITARMFTTLIISGWRAARYPQNAAYILRNAPSARAGLAAAASLTPRQLNAACEGAYPS
ncbi:phosphotransferase [Tabrizicola sp.]|uniref:phosphotransferase n=1 Tax=Tabrizicola sp. TaxID=2005166 RepID=UPI00261EF78C|nr:phosphotransferase [Tabrizicola sp.]MDM7930276.1 phosphotransferase [Tabrizicola sp.]